MQMNGGETQLFRDVLIVSNGRLVGSSQSF
jgi:hypothetical protein